MAGKLPDLEALAIFAKVVEMKSFARAAEEIALSKPTVSKAVTRLEKRLGTRLFNRTSRRLALTEAGRALAQRAAGILAEGEAAETETLAQSAAPRGIVRLSAPMSFGVLYLAPLLPEFFRAYPEVSVDLHLSDAIVDIIGEGFDAAIRIAALADSALVARRLCPVSRHLLAAPSYLAAHGRPKHPLDLAKHVGLAYSHRFAAETWHFRKRSGEVATVVPQGPLRVNNGEAMLPSLIAGIGLAILPEFIAHDAIRSGKLEIVLPEWSLAKSAVHWITPSAGPRPRRLQALADYLAKKLTQKTAPEAN